jgi:prepilin-type N-terminal cleavage/methylation domain-containing protein
MSKKGFTLTELLIASLVLAIFMMAIFRLQGSMTRTSQLIQWKTETQMTIRQFFKKYLIPDIHRASYPSTIHEQITQINNGSDPTDAMKLQYLSGGDSDGKIYIKDLANGTKLMEWQINQPSIDTPVENVAAKGVICTVRAYQSKDGIKDVITYERTGNIKDIPNITEKVVLKNVDYIKFTQQDRYTAAEINQMNIINNNPSGQLLDPSDPEYFHTWQNSGTINIEIGMYQNNKVGFLLGSKHKFTTAAKISIKTNVQIIPQANIN